MKPAPPVIRTRISSKTPETLYRISEQGEDTHLRPRGARYTRDFPTQRCQHSLRGVRPHILHKTFFSAIIGHRLVAEGKKNVQNGPGVKGTYRLASPDASLAEEEPVSLARAFGGHSALREFLETLLLAIIVFLALNLLTGRFQVRGSSMNPTLFNGEYVLVTKPNYWFRPPERGDIVVFHPPTDPSVAYIKRIIGLPGETIEIHDGKVWINGVSLEEPYIVAPTPYTGTWDLGEDEYFVLGDNRADSGDSHVWGVLPRRNIVGKAWLIYWPPESWGLVPHHAFPELRTTVGG